jgi:hypothetical protein
MSNAIKQLSDDKLDQVRHMLRRGAHTALQIAEFIGNIDGTDHAKEMVVSRYKQSAEYTKWLDRWENQDVELKKQIAMQKQKFEFLQSLVGNGDDNGLNAVSKNLQARLLTIAAEASDDELKEAKWVKNVIKIVQEQNKLVKASVGQEAIAIVNDKKMTEAEKNQAMKDIFQIQ